MIDRIDINIQALGTLNHKVDDPGFGNVDLRTGHDFGPAYINAVADHDYAFGQTMHDPPFEIFNDEKTPDRAWRYPYLGGDVTAQTENARALAEPSLVRENLRGTEGVRDPVYSGVNAVQNRDPLNPIPPHVPVVTVLDPGPPSPPSYGRDSADLPRQMVDLITTERAFQAGAQAIRTVEQTAGTIMNAFA